MNHQGIVTRGFYSHTGEQVEIAVITRGYLYPIVSVWAIGVDMSSDTFVSADMSGDVVVTVPARLRV